MPDLPSHSRNRVRFLVFQAFVALASLVAFGVGTILEEDRPYLAGILAGLFGGILLAQCAVLIVSYGLGPDKFSLRLQLAALSVLIGVLFFIYVTALEESSPRTLSRMAARAWDQWRWAALEVVVAVVAGSFLVLGAIRRWLLRIETITPPNDGSRNTQFQFRLKSLFAATFVFAIVFGITRLAWDARPPDWLQAVVVFGWLGCSIIGALFAGLGRQAGLWPMIVVTSAAAASAPLLMKLSGGSGVDLLIPAALASVSLIFFIGSLLALYSRGWRLRGRWQRWESPWRTPSGASQQERWRSIYRALARFAAGAVIVGALFYVLVVRPGERQRRVGELVKEAGGEIEFSVGWNAKDSITIALASKFLPTDWCHNIDSVSLKNCENVSQLLPKVAVLSRLAILELDGTSTTDNDLQTLPNHSGLVVLGLANTQVSDQGLRIVSKLPKLKVLDLSGTNTTDAVLAELKDSLNLRVLVLWETKISDAGLAHLTNLPSLSSLYLSHTAIGDDGLAHLSGMSSLSDLWLSGTKTSDHGLQHLRGLNLTSLGLAGTQVTDAGMPILQGYPRLAELELVDCEITDAGLEKIGRLTSLTELYIRHAKISNAGLVHLESLQQLKALNLEGTAISDDGLSSLLQLNSLKELNLARTQVTDAGIVGFVPMRTLRQLDVRHTAVTPAAADRLRKESSQGFLLDVLVD